MPKAQQHNTGCAVWFVGLPGSGKSTLARGVAESLRARGEDVVYLQMDEQRKKYFPDPAYTPEERETAYRMFAEEGAELAGTKTVIMDGTAHELAMRQHARKLAPCFIEVYIRCPLEVAMKREAGRPEGLVMADLYHKALERKKSGRDVEGLGQVIGVDVPFEENPDAECVLDSDRVRPEEGRDRIVKCIQEIRAKQT